MKLRVGETVADRYRLVRELGRGVRGPTWLAHDDLLDGECAIKLLDDPSKSDESAAHFAWEARVAAQLRGTHVVDVFEHGVWMDTPFIVMEYLQGETLAARLERSARTPLPPDEAYRVVAHAARALGHAHSVGIVHGAVNEENLFLVSADDGPSVKVLNFAGSRAHYSLRDRVGATVSYVNSPYYVSPEQARGKAVDHRSDLWSLGVIAFHCLTGSPPFESEALGELMGMILYEEPPSPTQRNPSLPVAVDAWWRLAVARDRDERFQSAKELADGLARALQLNLLAVPALSPGDSRETLGPRLAIPPGAVDENDDHLERRPPSLLARLGERVRSVFSARRVDPPKRSDERDEVPEYEANDIPPLEHEPPTFVPAPALAPAPAPSSSRADAHPGLVRAELCRLLITDPRDQLALDKLNEMSTTDPREHALTLEAIAEGTPASAPAANWFAAAANVWLTSVGDTERASRLLSVALDCDPTHPESAERLAALYRQRGDERALFELLQRLAAALGPLASNSDIRQRLAAIHTELGELRSGSTLSQRELAILHFRRALELDPSYQYAIYGLRESYKALERWAEAIPLFPRELALEADPKRKVALLWDEAYIRSLAGDRSGSAQAFRAAREAERGSGVDFEAGKAIEVLLRAVESDQDEPLLDAVLAVLDLHERAVVLDRLAAHAEIAGDHDGAMGRLMLAAARASSEEERSRLLTRRAQISLEKQIAPSRKRVFISYSHDSEEHRQQVLVLAQQLRQDGVDVRLDQFVHVPAEGWPRWMRQEIELADFVLLVCTARYKRRFEGIEPGGANWEGFLTESMLYEDDARNLRFVPVLLRGQTRDVIPSVVRPTTRYALPSDYESLFARITNQLATVPVPIGELRVLDNRDRRNDPELRMLEEQRKELTLASGDASEVIEAIKVRRRQLRDTDDIGKGARLARGRYELVEHLGYGGFAAVWKAWDQDARHAVALKILHRQHLEDRSRRERFFRGARIMGRLNHPAIVRVLEEQGYDEEDRACFFVMEYVEGGDLHQAVVKGRVGAKDCVPIVLKVAEALEHAHAIRVIHRDVKPENVLVTPAGGIKLTDFDLVHAPDTTGGTRTGAMGTFLFAAPELMRDAKRVDGRVDVYSLGMIAQFILWGRSLPAEALTSAQQFRDELAWPAGLRPIVDQACELDRERRHASVSELCNALRSLHQTSLGATPQVAPT